VDVSKVMKGEKEKKSKKGKEGKGKETARPHCPEMVCGKERTNKKKGNRREEK